MEHESNNETPVDVALNSELKIQVGQDQHPTNPEITNIISVRHNLSEECKEICNIE
jgi:hypothetical protein